MAVYDHKKIEAKWRQIWQQKRVYQPSLRQRFGGGKHDKEKRPYYNLMMFPYPSAEGLHVGNMYAFTGSDVWGRYMRMKGFDVFEPIGLDGFGIHSENYAIKVGKHPAEQAKKSQKNFYRQLQLIGNGFAWENRLETYDPEYYRWTQWIFIQLFKQGLAYRQKAPVNWCPSCKTVLADEQVINARCERCSSLVTQKDLKQWFFRITRYADRLLENLDKIDWDNKVKVAQRNWIGRNEGLKEKWQVADLDLVLETFTTWPHTTWGATFIVIAPEHPFIDKLVKGTKYELAVKTFCRQVIKQKASNPVSAAAEKKGEFTGRYAINPLTDWRMPIYVANFVLMEVGTGVVKGAPAHDERDFEFAVKYGLDIKRVVAPIDEYRSVVFKASVGGDFSEKAKKLGCKVGEGKSPSGKEQYQIVMKKSQVERFLTLVKKEKKKGFWVELIGKRIWFVFDDGVFELGKDLKSRQVLARCKQIEPNVRKRKSLFDMLSKNSHYRDLFPYLEEGVMINAGKFTGMKAPEARRAIAEYSRKKNGAEKMVDYHLRDWLISRQRYWGPPIPMIYCQACAKAGKSWFSEHSDNSQDQKNQKTKQSATRGFRHSDDMAGWWPVPEEDLPVLLPQLKDFKPTGDGKAPLERAGDSFIKVDCPGCGGEARRETDVSDTFLDSAWYFLRYPSINNQFSSTNFQSTSNLRIKKLNNSLKTENSKIEKLPWDPQITKRWLPVDMYIGGAEHSVLHLLYSRFLTMVFKDMGLLSFEEPFTRFRAHGLIIKDGAKMSKSKGNVVNPDEYIAKYGADTLRTYLMFVGPLRQGGDFRDTAMAGMYRFLERVWNTFQENKEVSQVAELKFIGEKTDPKLQKKLHQTIKRATEGIERLKYNTAIAAIMEFVNTWRKPAISHQGTDSRKLSWVDAGVVVRLLAPFAPHLSEELWQMLLEQHHCHDQHCWCQKTSQLDWPERSVHRQWWPRWQASMLQEAQVTIIVQVNGKLRGQIKVKQRATSNKQQVVSKAKADERVAKWLKNKKVKKEVFVPGRLVNFVVS